MVRISLGLPHHACTMEIEGVLTSMSGIRYGWRLRIVRICKQASDQIVKVYDLYQWNLQCSYMSRMKTLLPTTIRTKTYQDYSVVKTNLKAENQRQKYFYHKTSCLSLTCPANWTSYQSLNRQKMKPCQSNLNTTWTVISFLSLKPDGIRLSGMFDHLDQVFWWYITPCFRSRQYGLATHGCTQRQ